MHGYGLFRDRESHTSNSSAQSFVGAASHKTDSWDNSVNA